MLNENELALLERAINNLMLHPSEIPTYTNMVRKLNEFFEDHKKDET